MEEIYKPFRSIRTALALSFIAFSCMCLSAPVVLASAVYTVEGIEVDVSDENAIKAREKAFLEAQIKAFEALASRLVTEDELVTLQMPDQNQLARFIHDFEVRDEKLSSKRYIGTYTFRFKDSAVKNFFSGAGSEFTDLSSAPLLVLPFWEDQSGQSVIWSPQNTWMQAWLNTDTSKGLVPLVVPLGDLQDVQDIGDHEALTYNPRNLSSMLRRYGASEAVVAIAKPQIDGGVAVQIYRTDRDRPEYVDFVQQGGLAGQNPQMAYELAVKKVKSALRKDWKKKTGIAPQERGAGLVQAKIAFENLGQWTKIQQALGRVQGIQDVTLKALSPREAYIELSYDGGLERLKLALEQQSFALNVPRFEYTRGVYYRAQAAMQNAGQAYELTYMPYAKRMNDVMPQAGQMTAPSPTYRAQF